MNYKGTVQIRLDNRGSKSEGKYAHILLEDGEDYILYRGGTMPANDAFFAPYDAQKVEVEGEMEKDFGYICVTHIQPTSSVTETEITNQ